MKAFGWSWEFVDERLPGGQGWAWYTWAVESEVKFWGGKVERKGPGYIGQERERILSEWKAK